MASKCCDTSARSSIRATWTRSGCSPPARRCSCPSGTSRCRRKASRSGSATSASNNSTSSPLSQTITKPEALIEALWLDPQLLPSARAANESFALRVPAPFLARIKPGDPDDPLLKQILPVSAELEEQPGYVPDPLEESAARRAPGLLQKYAGRALLITTQACAIHCRYCFRREFPYADQVSEDGERWSEALAGIARDASIEEVILSGGDPLTLGDARLQQITDALGA